MRRSLSMLAIATSFACACDRPASPTSSLTTSAPAPAPSAVPSAAPSLAPSASASAPAPGSAASPDAFEAVVGEWRVSEDNGKKVLEVDGSKWRSGEPSAGLADQAKHLYGDRYAEFLDGVKAFAFFPFAVWKGDAPSGDVRISVRFFPKTGKIDQAAGIIFQIAPDGSYWGVRANALEDNLLFFKVVKGKRSVIDNVRNVPTPTAKWHTLSVELRGKKLTATVDSEKRFEKALDFAPSGRVGLWSKADSQVLFDDFRVEPLSSAP